MKNYTKTAVTAILFTIIAFGTNVFGQTKKGKVEMKNPVYQHTLIFYLKTDLSQKEILDFQNFFEGLAKLPYQKNLRYGMPAASTPRPVLDQTYTYSATMEFDTLEDLETYGKLPEHLALVAKYKPYFRAMKVYDTVLNVKNK